MPLSINRYQYYQYQEGKKASGGHSIQGHRAEPGWLDWWDTGAGMSGPPCLGAQGWGGAAGAAGERPNRR